MAGISPRSPRQNYHPARPGLKVQITMVVQIYLGTAQTGEERNKCGEPHTLARFDSDVHRSRVPG